MRACRDELVTCGSQLYKSESSRADTLRVWLRLGKLATGSSFPLTAAALPTSSGVSITEA